MSAAFTLISGADGDDAHRDLPQFCRRRIISAWLKQIPCVHAHHGPLDKDEAVVNRPVLPDRDSMASGRLYFRFYSLTNPTRPYHLLQKDGYDESIIGVDVPESREETVMLRRNFGEDGIHRDYNSDS
ncbi:hypothetical protein [Burkholderia sp. Bp8963]|uniref:hypothetical protein n=1 Tax=Burkholderia sp. Bp8963 TaxID=2184547 RepID=UPI000F59DE8C|nr:hypothetical protein [Burkholderia sp. Bp8963]